MRSIFDRTFGDALTNWGGPDPWHLRFPVEVMERGDDLVVRVELAGIDPKDVDVRITDEGVTLRGEHKQETEPDRAGVRHTERFYGTFRNGLLEVTAPRRRPNDGRDGRKLEIDTQ